MHKINFSWPNCQFLPKATHILKAISLTVNLVYLAPLAETMSYQRRHEVDGRKKKIECVRGFTSIAESEISKGEQPLDIGLPFTY